MTKIFSIPFGNLWGLRLVGEERERERTRRMRCVFFPEILFLRRFVVLVLSPTTWMGADRVS